MSLIGNNTSIPTDTGKIIANDTDLTKIISVHNGVSEVVWEKETKKEYTLIESSSPQNLIYYVDASLNDESYNGRRYGYTDFDELITCNGQYLYIDASRYNSDENYSCRMQLYLKDENGNRTYHSNLFVNRGADQSFAWANYGNTDLSTPKQIQLPSSGKYYISLFVDVMGYYEGWAWVGWKIKEMKINKELQ